MRVCLLLDRPSRRSTWRARTRHRRLELAVRPRGPARGRPILPRDDAAKVYPQGIIPSDRRCTGRPGNVGTNEQSQSSPNTQPQARSAPPPAGPMKPGECPPETGRAGGAGVPQSPPPVCPAHRSPGRAVLTGQRLPSPSRYQPWPRVPKLPMPEGMASIVNPLIDWRTRACDVTTPPETGPVRPSEAVSDVRGSTESGLTPWWRRCPGARRSLLAMVALIACPNGQLPVRVENPSPSILADAALLARIDWS
jgi:hypothetical protein